MSSEQKTKRPPRLADRLLEYYCRNELLDSIQGDMHEQFLLDLKKYGRFKARRRYWSNVLTFANRYTLKRESGPRQHHNTIAMFKNYVLVTLRTLRRKPVFSLINLVGLAVGLATCMIIFLYVQHETTFDSFHKNADRIYRVTNVYEPANGTNSWIRTPPALAPAIAENFPGIANVTRMRYADEYIFRVEDNAFRVDNGMYADSLFLDIFSFELARGNRSSALDEPNSIILSRELAQRLFGSEEAMNKVIRFDNERNLKVTGVLADLPSNSHLDFDYLISFNTYVVPQGYLADLNSWGWGGFYTYIMLDDGVGLETLQAGINDLLKANYTRADTKASAPLQPLKRLYLDYPEFTNIGGATRVGSRPTIYALSGIALLVLIVAGLNFMNLSTAMSLSRGKEIGMRKVMGAVRAKVRLQFLLESITLAMLSMLLAILLVSLTGQTLINLLGIKLQLSGTALLSALPWLVLFTLSTGLLSGIYPSLVLSGFSAIKAMKGRLTTSSSGTLMRKGLTTFQFIVSIGLIAVSLLIVKQTGYMRDQPLGFSQENVISLELFTDDVEPRYAAIKNKFLRNPAVSKVARTSHLFNGSSSSGPARLIGATTDEAVQMNYYQAGYSFLDLTDIELISGRYFAKDFPNDTAEAMILNETAVARLGLDEPLGARIHFNNRDRRVIGVVSDFHINSLHSPVQPMAIVMPFTPLSTILVRTNSANYGELLSQLEADWKAIVPEAPFDARFLDDGIRKMYEQEEQLAELISVLSSLAVLLACLGLYGLVSFSVQARMKEVGVRKVLGAPVRGMLVLLSKQFLWLILLASLIAWPLIYFIGTSWLDNFSYRMNMGIGFFILPTLMLLVLAMITLSHQVLKAALSNPVKVLRSE